MCADGPRPSQTDIVELRFLMLEYVRQLVLRGSGVQDDELQSILNFLSTIHEVCCYAVKHEHNEASLLIVTVISHLSLELHCQGTVVLSCEVSRTVVVVVAGLVSSFVVTMEAVAVMTIHS